MPMSIPPKKSMAVSILLLMSGKLIKIIRTPHHLFTMTTMLGFQIITIPGTLATEQRNKKAQDNSLLLLWLSRYGRSFKMHKKEREFSGVSGIDEEFTP